MAFRGRLVCQIYIASQFVQQTFQNDFYGEMFINNLSSLIHV